MQWQLPGLGVTFHLYGLIVGLAMAVGGWLMELKAKREHINTTQLWPMIAGGLLGALIGARLWHVATDFPLYTHNWWAIVQVWQGGLSILGAIAGGVLGLKITRHFFYNSENISLSQLLDLSVYGLPVAQGIGRVGNWVNQELYGLPTTLPWGIFIEPQHRLAGYESQAYYHPLFAYEMIFTLGFAAWLWWREFNLVAFEKRKNKKATWLQFGCGNIFTVYILYYAVLRWGLEFLRLEKAGSGIYTLSINQVIITIVIFLLTWKLCLAKHD
ncbi:MAG TPA: prolipoprotein diacylglyceryl transferase [Vitreimonas sp.]|nr:prolipoprotein diacylglyceryl transferase [Vitreimonas sp.]